MGILPNAPEVAVAADAVGGTLVAVGALPLGAIDAPLGERRILPHRHLGRGSCKPPEQREFGDWGLGIRG
jgi:hypothetical protein